LVTSAGASSDPLAASRLRQQLLLEALSPPSGKLSISPELSIQESTDPTAILLQSNAIKVLSERLRSVAKANSVWISGSLTTLQTFCAEQELARGKIPGPIPVVYCGSGVVAAAADPSIVENINGLEYLHSVATAGAHGIVIPILEGLPVTSLDQIVANEWVATCQQALTCGLVPIPEITLREDAAKTWKEEDVATLVDRLAQIGGIELASMLLTVQNSEDATNADASSDKEQALSPSSSSSLPPISKELRRKVPIIGSVRVAAGENRMGMETARFKNAGYSGTLLRHECVPESLRYSKNIDLMGRFWTNCIGDLKSTRSKAFNFRAKNNMEKSHTEMWANYMKEVSESGAMGNESDATGPPVDATSGEYRGFA
jgi:hypothetical protein